MALSHINFAFDTAEGSPCYIAAADGEATLMYSPATDTIVTPFRPLQPSEIPAISVKLDLAQVRVRDQPHARRPDSF